jgi:hypothetical protein
MAFDSFNFRVFAQTTGAKLPHDGPQGTSASPHPTGLPDFFSPPFVAPSLLSLPNGPISTNDAWLAPGATQTIGNNVDAYVDLASPDGFSAGDFRATSTSASTFDRTYDVNQDPAVSSDQRMASIAQLFYDNNFLHDWFYDSGLTRRRAMARRTTSGAAAWARTRCAPGRRTSAEPTTRNMSTPPDGSPGRMQMYVFTPASERRGP